MDLRDAYVESDDRCQNHGPRQEKEPRLFAQGPFQGRLDARETQLHLMTQLADVPAICIHSFKQAYEVVRSVRSKCFLKLALQVR